MSEESYSTDEDNLRNGDEEDLRLPEELRELLLYRRIEEFIHAEAAALDDGRYDDWVAMFVPDGHYWATADAAQESPYEGDSLIFENVSALRTRLAGLSGPRPDTGRLVGNIRLEGRNPRGDAFEVSARFQMALRTRKDETRTLAGRYDYALLQQRPDEFRIAVKKATLLGAPAEGEFDGLPI